MSRLLLGTRNEGKIQEAKELLTDVVGLELLHFPDFAFSDVPETGKTFLENALLKATAIARETGLPVLSEDSGLEVHALDGAPGVLSARFAGQHSDPYRNNEVLLEKLTGEEDRRARFITVAVLFLQDGQVFATSGIFEGTIAHSCSGRMGFGYDPLFMPDGEIRTLAQMTLKEKNVMSHRYKALSRMATVIDDLIQAGELE